MEFLNTIFYTAVTLGILIFVHELGHFAAAKLTGMRVDRFSIGFPPRAFGKKIGDTDYCISWLPIGGYVKIAGMVDESMDTEFADKPAQPWEFRARPMWARITVISAGVIMNVALAVFIFSSIHSIRGKDFIDTTEIAYVHPGSAAATAGFERGDRIMRVNGASVNTWEELQQLVYIEFMGSDLEIVVERKGQERLLSVDRQPSPEFAMDNLGFSVAGMVSFVNAVSPDMPAEAAGLQPGDTILAADGEPVLARQQLIDMIRSNTGDSIRLTWNRMGQVMSGTSAVTDSGFIGIVIGSVYTGPTRHIEYSASESILGGFAEAGMTVRLFVLTISKIVSGEASVQQSFGGPIAIAQLATQSAEYGLLAFLWFMAQLSMSLAILNILPIPALDGGHLVMLLIEKISRREIPHKVKIAIQQAGFVLLLAFMAFVIYNDISRF